MVQVIAICGGGLLVALIVVILYIFLCKKKSHHLNDSSLTLSSDKSKRRSHGISLKFRDSKEGDQNLLEQMGLNSSEHWEGGEVVMKKGYDPKSHRGERGARGGSGGSGDSSYPPGI